MPHSIPRPEPSTGERLKALLKERGLTQAQLADHLGVDRTYVSQMATNKVNWINSSYFQQIARLLMLSVDQIRELNPDAVVTVEQPRRGPPVPPVVDAVTYTLPVPEALQIVIDNYGDQFPQLRNEALIRSVIPPRMFDGDGPQTSEQWLEYFLMNRRWWPEE